HFSCPPPPLAITYELCVFLSGQNDRTNDSYPPTAQPKTRAERHTSWGLGLGTRSSFHVDSLGHAHSRSLSGSVSGPAPQTIPEHPTNPTPPPQLPQTSRHPPFDSLTQGNGNQDPARTPPRPRTPKQLAGPHGDGDSEPVSPVSETHSLPGPKSYATVDDEGLHVGGDVWVPRPTGKAHTPWDPLTTAPLIQEKSFETGQSRALTPHAPNAHQATQAQMATTPRNNPADDQYDDWVVVSPHSPSSGHIQVVSPQSPLVPSRSSEQSTELGKEVINGDGARPTPTHATHLYPQQGQQQTIQHLPSQQHQAESPQRNPSFVGLPPIRRGSTFGINLTKRAKKRFSLDEDEDARFTLSPASNAADQHDHNTFTSPRLQQGDPSWSAQSAQPARIDTGPSSSRKDNGMSIGVFSATSTQAATFATDSTGVTGSDWRIDDEKRPLEPGAAFNGVGRVPRPIHTGATVETDGRPDGPPYGPGMRPQQGMVSPTFGGEGNPIHHLPPQGPWKLEESHLSEPLATSRSRQSGGSLSPQRQDFFGYEKETGVPPQAASRPETQLPPRHKFSEVPPSSAQRYPSLFSPPQWEQNIGSPTGPRRSHDLGQQYYGRDSTSLYRTQTGDSEVSTFDPSVDEERGRSRRNSGFFKEIGDPFSREPSQRQPPSKAEEAAASVPSGPDVQRNEVSEASVATGEFQDQQRRRSSFFLNLRGPRPSDTGVPQSREDEGITQLPKASPKPDISPRSQQPAGFTDSKRSFIGSASNESTPVLPIPNLSRSSTSTAGNGAAGVAVGPPKKRFSGFTSKVFNRTSIQQDLQIPHKPGTSHSTTSSMLGRSPGTPMNQPSALSPLAPQGRERTFDVESDEQAALFSPRPEAQNVNVSRKKPDNLLNRTSQTEEKPGVHTSQTQKDQCSPEPHCVSEHRHYSSSTQLHRELPLQFEQLSDQNPKGRFPPDFSAEPTPEPSIRHGKESEQALSSLTPPLSQSHGGNARALDIQGHGHTRQISDQAASPPSSSSVRAQSSTGLVVQVEMSQRSSVSNSPKPPATSQVQTPPTSAVSGRQMSPPGSFNGNQQPSPFSVHSNGPPSSLTLDYRNSNRWRLGRSACQRARSSRECHLLVHSLKGVLTPRRDTIICTNNSVNPHHPWVCLVIELTRRTMHPLGALMRGRITGTCRTTKGQQPQPQGFIEPQYDQVPIPQGYVAVHGEGSVVPSPYAIPRTSPPGQFLPHQVPPVQQWGPPPAALRQSYEVPSYNQPGAAAPHVQYLLESQMQPNTIAEGSRQISVASHQSNIYESHNVQPGTAGPNGDPPLLSQHNQQDRTGLLNATDDGNSRVAVSNSRYSQPKPLFSQQPRHQRLSPVNTVTPSVASSQAHQTRSGDMQGQNAVASQTKVHSDDVQAASQTAASLEPRSRSQTQGLAVDGGSIERSNSRSASPGTQVATERVVSPEPPVPTPAASPLIVNVHKANQDNPDDIYDSTPRLPLGPPPPPAQPIAATATGRSMANDSPADEAPQNALHANGGAGGSTSTTLAKGKSTRAELEDTEDERKRTIRHLAQEEKILVDPYEELQSGGVKYRKEEDPEVPQMSATSYPGQEWNPYGAGGYEDWD
ncbi:hypothetical protein LX36DRAFT_719482, partial [Colletotrichum falcatum]